MHNQHLSIDTLKIQAKALRRSLANDGHVMSHSASLETLAKQNGYKDWNTLSAIASKAVQAPFTLGDAVRGTYLGQAFEGQIVGLRLPRKQNRYEVTIKFDVPVDVVKFDGMSNFRSRVTLIVNETGASDDKTSDGQPHLALELQ